MILIAVGLTVLLVGMQLSKGATYSSWSTMWNGLLEVWNALSIWGKIGFVVSFWESRHRTPHCF
jgi:hypothetical protein